MAVDAALRQAFKDWLAKNRPKNVPQSSLGVLQRAERRLVAGIQHDEPAARLAANVERVRRAQLGCLKAQDRVAELPTDVGDDEQVRLRRASLAEAKTVWESATVDEILAYYADGGLRE